MQCYANSLQTCQDIIKHSSTKLVQIEFIEFMEMCGRVAHCLTPDQAGGTDLLDEKINVVLDSWLGLVG